MISPYPRVVGCTEGADIGCAPRSLVVSGCADVLCSISRTLFHVTRHYALIPHIYRDRGVRAYVPRFSLILNRQDLLSPLDRINTSL